MPPKRFFQLLASAFFPVAVVVLGDEVVQHFLGNIGGGVGNVLRPFLGHEAQALVANVEDLGQALRSAAFRMTSASSPFRGRDPISSFG